MTRPAPHANFNGVDLHPAANAGKLFWIGGPAAAYSVAAAYLQYDSALLRRFPQYEAARQNVQARTPGGVAFVFGPSASNDGASARLAFHELLDMLNARQWHILKARDFLSIVEDGL